MIYCVEDDRSIRELMVYTLQVSGFEACGFQDAAAFWDMMKEKKPELVILDIMLPGEDGISMNIHQNQRLLRNSGEDFGQELQELRVKYKI